MWLIKSKVEEHYQNERGDLALITMYPDRSVVLTIRNGDNLEEVFRKAYNTRKGARIALGRFGKWKYVITVDTIKKGKTEGEVLRAVSKA